MEFTQALKWRYATKQFDSTQKLSEDVVQAIIEDTLLSATSFGLQPYEMIVVSDPQVREKLKAASFGQPQITDASHVIVLAARTDVSTDMVDRYVERIADVRGIPAQTLDEYAGMMKGFVSQHDQQALTTWAQKQTYIALGTLMAAAAVREVDGCPMEGFNPQQYNEILGLDNLTATVVFPIGKRSSEDKYAEAAKVRWPTEDVVHRV